jgi:hypothetical protein
VEILGLVAQSKLRRERESGVKEVILTAYAGCAAGMGI